MTTPRNHWLLKVIVGPNQGAEVGVRVGKMLIGSDGECDVVLQDALVAPQHVEVEASAGGGITVAPLGGRVFINGKRVRDARQTVPDFAFVSLGGSHIIIGPDEGKWPLLSAADVPELEKETEVTGPAETKATPVPDAVVQPQAPVNGAPAPAQSVDKHSRTRAFFGIAAGVILLVIWFIAYQFYINDSANDSGKVSASAKPADRVRAVVDSMGLGDTIKIEESAGRVSVSGYVDTEARQRELQAAFRQAVPGLNTRIYSLEKIASSARALLDDAGLPLTVTSLSEGRLKVVGKLPAADPWVRTRQTLRRVVPGLNEIEDAVEIDTPRIGSLPRTGTVSTSGRPISAPEGRPSPSTSKEPESTGEYLVTADTIDTPQATVAAIKIGGESLGFMRLSSGGVYFNGSRLPYGGKIVSISAGGVTIDENGSLRIAQQGDLVAKPKSVNPDNLTKAP